METYDRSVYTRIKSNGHMQEKYLRKDKEWWRQKKSVYRRIKDKTEAFGLTHSLWAIFQESFVSYCSKQRLIILKLLHIYEWYCNCFWDVTVCEIIFHIQRNLTIGALSSFQLSTAKLMWYESPSLYNSWRTLLHLDTVTIRNSWLMCTITGVEYIHSAELPNVITKKKSRLCCHYNYCFSMDQWIKLLKGEHFL